MNRILEFLLLTLLANCSGLSNYGGESRKDRSAFSSLGADSTSSPLKALHVAISKSNLAQGEKGQGKAVGLYLNGSVADLTKEVLWTASDKSVATVSNESDHKGEVRGEAEGKVQISAEIEELAEKTEVEVSKAAIIALKFPGEALPEALLDSCPDIEVGASSVVSPSLNTRQLKVFALYSDCSLLEHTNSVNWQSSDNNIAEFVAGAKGILTVKGAGDITVTVNLNDGEFSAQLANFHVDYAANPLGAFSIRSPISFHTITNNNVSTLAARIIWTDSTNAASYFVTQVSGLSEDCSAKTSGTKYTAIVPQTSAYYHSFYAGQPSSAYFCVTAATTGKTFTRAASNAPLMIVKPIP